MTLILPSPADHPPSSTHTPTTLHTTHRTCIACKRVHNARMSFCVCGGGALSIPAQSVFLSCCFSIILQSSSSDLARHAQAPPDRQAALWIHVLFVRQSPVHTHTYIYIYIYTYTYTYRRMLYVLYELLICREALLHS